MEKHQRYDVLKDLLIAEDRVFGDRMNIFLVVNSIMLIAYGQFKLPGFVIPALGVLLDLIWLYVGSLTLSAHNFWRDEMLKLEQEMFGEEAPSLGIVTRRREFYPRLARMTRFSSTESLAFILPLAFMAIWVYLLVK
jgi:hypothetical protein